MVGDRIRTAPDKLAVSILQLTLLVVALLTASPARADELVVSAAMSLREAFVEIGSQFEQKNPGDKIVFNFGASGELARQIDRGAPADVFASASFKEVNLLLRKRLLDERTIRVFARNTLVVIVPRGARRISSLQQLAQLEKVTIGNPETVPAGKYAAEALSAGKIYQQLLAQHKLIFAESVRQALAYVESANVDAGVVFSTDARVSREVSVSMPVPESDGAPIVYPVALISDSKHVKLGRDFIQFLKSPTAISVLKSKGFLTVDK